MTLNEILSDEALRRAEFPVAEKSVFLSHAAVCPLPARVQRAVADYAVLAARGDQETAVFPALLEEGRGVAAKFLGCDAGEVAFVGPTSLALSLFASGLRWRRQDNILIYFDDYPSNVYPWMALAERGVEVRLMNTRGLGVIRPRDVLGQVDENTRLVALASCHFISGYRLQVDEIGRQLRDRGILFCLDGIQTLGAYATPLQHVDMLAADGHKWMLGPCGAGLMYVRKEIQERLNPPLYGWHNVRSPQFVAQEQIVFRRGALKYEAGTHNLLGLVGLVAALKLLLEIGVDAISAELTRKSLLLREALLARGWSVLNANAGPENTSGIVSIHRPETDLPALHQALAARGIAASLRQDRSGHHYLRLSPHFYNTDAELRQCLDAL